jgi:DUF971 family protein
LIPIKIDVQKSESLLKIVWDDGHLSEYTFNLLRAACPCAECRGGHENMSAEPTPEMFETELPDSPAVHLENLSLVGSYGLSIQWQDGHAHGIFHWQYLRKLCTCEICQLDR